MINSVTNIPDIKVDYHTYIRIHLQYSLLQYTVTAVP